MFRKTCVRWLVIHAPGGVDFALSSAQALERVQAHYQDAWLTVKPDGIDFAQVQKVFVPFYLCAGHVEGVYTATASYTESRTSATAQSSGQFPTSTTRHVQTAPQPLTFSFTPAQTQSYAGYKYHAGSLHSVVRSPALFTRMAPIRAVNTTDAQLQLFEQSIEVMRGVVAEEVTGQARQAAEALVRRFHPTAETIAVHFSHLRVTVTEVFPCFAPVFVLQLGYDAQTYPAFVSGLTGTVAAPRLPDALTLARLAGLLGLTLGLVQTTNKIAGLCFGAFAGMLLYYSVFFAARWYPALWRRWQHRERERRRLRFRVVDEHGYHPTPHTARLEREFATSSYGASHQYEQGTDQDAKGGGWGGERGRGARTGFAPSGGPRDRKGYYRRLGLQGGESVNEIRSAYRKMVLRRHPDVGGSTEEMRLLNEAYRVLRNPESRAAYDRL